MVKKDQNNCRKQPEQPEQPKQPKQSGQPEQSEQPEQRNNVFKIRVWDWTPYKYNNLSISNVAQNLVEICAFLAGQKATHAPAHQVTKTDYCQQFKNCMWKSAGPLISKPKVC